MNSKLPALLGLVNVVLLVSSTILVYLGSALITFYLLDHLDFVSVYFAVVPRIMIAGGVATFLVALYGLFVAASHSRCNLIAYALLMIVLFIAQLATVFTAMELRGIINRDEYSSISAVESTRDYADNPATRRRWDALQREFGCCGAVNFNTGFNDWRNARVDAGGDGDAVPDSCCLHYSEGCGRDVFRASTLAHQKIHTHGCLTVMKHKLDDQVVPVLLGYAAVGTVLALIQLLGVVFAFSYSAAISRHRKLDETKSFVGAPHPSIPPSPRFDHSTLRSSLGRNGNTHGSHHHFAQENLSTVFSDEQNLYEERKSIRAYADSPTSQLREREV